MLPFIAFQCSKDDTETKPDCGCEGKTVEVLKDVECIVYYPDSESALKILCPGWVYNTCYLSDSIRNRIAIDSLRIIMSGEVKPACPSDGIGRPDQTPHLIITKLEVIN